VAEFEFQTGQIPIGDGMGKEVITRFTTGVKSNSMYYTDSNGREFQTRKRNYRPTWNLTVTEPVAGNYYPVNVAAYLKDANSQFSILTYRSQGGGSINDGQFELMFHRRLLWDDGRGVGEPLNETDGITPYPDPHRLGTGLHLVGSHYVYVDTPANSLAVVRAAQSRIFSPLVLGFTTLSTNVPQWIASHTVTRSWANQELPLNVDLITLQPTGAAERILRLSHLFGVGEDSKYSSPVTVDISKLFTFPVMNLKEVSLTTNKNVSEMKQMKWKTTDDVAPAFEGEFDGSSVTITPMDVRTFTFSTA